MAQEERHDGALGIATQPPVELPWTFASPYAAVSQATPPSQATPSQTTPGQATPSHDTNTAGVGIANGVNDGVFNDDSPPGRSSASSSAAPGDAPSRDTTVPAACLGCRSKHLKCNGQTPCSRCTASASECIYVASRRGYKGPRRSSVLNSNKRQATSPPDGHGDTSLAGASAAIAFTPSASMMGAQTPGQPYGGYGDMGLVPHSGAPVASRNVVVPLAERCLDSFYRNFHASHPFVLPKVALMQIARDSNIEPLLAAIRLAGSLYIDVGSSGASLMDEACRLVHDPQAAQDGFLIQAIMVLIVALDGNCRQDMAKDLLGEAETLALRIALNTRPFATLHGRGMPVLEESWRRTWWDLYVIDGMIAGVHQVTNFLLFDIPAAVALPCEEYQYMAGVIPQPLYLEDLEDRDLSGDDREFSSFAYRILCARILGRFMRTPPAYGPDDENLARIEAQLTNWRLHLPAPKRNALRRDGQLDEMMFQAHMMHHATSILVHQPHSQLDSSPARRVDSCAPHRLVPSGDVFNAHTKHTITAAGEISKLVTYRVPLLSHTHFFTCVLTLSSIVHLSKWALFFVPHDDDDLRQQIRLNMGALDALSVVWGAADRARGQVRGVAQEIYRVKKQQQSNPQYWLGFSQDQVVNSIAADESIIGDIEGLDAGISAMPNLLG